MACLGDDMGKETILILDENKNTAWTLKTLLENEGYCVLIVDSIERAIKDFREFRVSGLITEYRVGDLCTLGVIRELRKVCPESYVMMVTDVDVKEEEYTALIQGGVDDYFLKPVSAGKILLHLKKGVTRRSHQPEEKERVREVVLTP
jgi:DNA-binding response OmpR family regulator